ncbi:MAG: gliding motility-associated C-terminal domain-containing protein [Flavobacteriales bacterium]
MKALIYISILFPSILTAQITLDRQVFGAMGGGSVQPGYSIDYTIGEPIVRTATGGNFDFTQGFQQPFTIGPVVIPLSATFQVVPESCFGAADGSVTITSITGCDSNYTVEWNDLSNGNSVSGLTGGTQVSVTIVSDDGCMLTESFIIILNPGADCALEIFNAFSPNGDGKNDIWYIGNALSWQPNSVTIFDRWGNTIWTADNYDNINVVWDGSDKNGRALPDGTYFFVFVAGTEVKKGFVEITR